MQSIGESCLQSTEGALGSGSIPSCVDGVKRMFVLEVSVHGQGACIEGSKEAVWHWATLVKDDSGPADVEGLGHMCVLWKGFWKGRKCALKIMMGSSPMDIDAAGCKVLDTPLALHALSLVLSEGEPFNSQSSLVCFVRQMGSDEAGVADHNLGLVCICF